VIKGLLARNVLQPDKLKKIYTERFVESLEMIDDYGALLRAMHSLVPRVFENKETAAAGRSKKGNMMFDELI
jgi:hypothetical protein